MRFAFPLAVAALVLFAAPGVGVFVADLLGYGPDLNARLESRLGLSHRLALSLPAAVVLLLVPVVVILLHMLRLRRRALVVSSTLLWRASAEDLHANALLRWLRRNVPLLLQLLAAFFLIYAVLGPRLHAAAVTGRHYILVIDNSASMAAVDAPGSRLEWAKAEALREIDRATDGDTGMVVAFNRTADIRQGYTNDRELLRAAVRGIGQSNGQTRFDEALRLSAGLANPDRSTENEVARPADATPGKDRTYVPPGGLEAEIHLYSDGGFRAVSDFSLANLTLTYHAPPTPKEAGNVAIVRADATRDEPGHLSVTASVRNYRPDSVERAVRLDVLEGSRAVRTYARPLRLGGGASGEVTFVIPETGSPVRLALEGGADALPLDDVVWLSPANARKPRVAVVGPPNKVLDAFFDSPAARLLAEVTRFGGDAAKAERFLGPARQGRFDLVLFDRCGPEVGSEMPRANTLFVGSRPPGLAIDPNPVKNPRVVGWAGSHPVTRGLRGLQDVPFAEAVRFTSLPPRTDRLIEADGTVVLLAGLPRPPFTDLVLALTLVDGDGRWNTLWPLEPSFVLFLRNVVRAYGNPRGGLGDEVVRPGDPVTLRTGAAERVTVVTPGGSTETLEPGDRGEVTFVGTGELGVYAVAGGDDRAGFGVNLFDPDESDIGPHGDVTVGDQTITPGELRRPPHELWKWAVVAGLLVLLAEWWTYAARVR